MEQISLSDQLKRYGFSEAIIDIIISWRQLNEKDLKDSEFLEAVEEANNIQPAKINIVKFLDVLANLIEAKKREIFSYNNERSRVFITRNLTEIGVDYSIAKKIVRIYSKTNIKVTPYELVQIAKYLFEPEINENQFINNLLKASAEIAINKNNSRAIIFKYQTKPYIITQQEFDLAIEMAKGNAFPGSPDNYSNILKYLMEQEAIKIEDWIDIKYIKNYSKMKELINLDPNPIKLLASILYVISGGRVKTVKELN